MLNVAKHGNTATEITTYTIKKGSEFAIGGVEGGIGTQVFIPKAVQNAGGNAVKKGTTEVLH